MNLLFVCSRNKLRSPTAEKIFSAVVGFEVASAGTAEDAEMVVSSDLVEWADMIFAMEAVHKSRLKAKFSQALRGKQVTVLGIPDNYSYMQPELVSLLRAKVTPRLPRTT